MNFCIAEAVSNLLVVGVDLKKKQEGFETQDSDYKYKVGVSKNGLWLSRKKKLIFIPVPPKTTTMINQPAEEEENSGNNNNDYSRDIPGPLRPTAFTNNNDNSNKSDQQNQQQLQEQQQPQQQQQQVVYPYSVKIEQSSSGAAKISIHTYNVDPDKARYEAIRLFIQTREELKNNGIKVL
jgi:hypothetical protein